MKKASFILISLLLTGLYSCSGWDEIDIDVNDPQHIEWVEDIIDEDLLDALNALSAQNGINYIHFGHTPPNLDNISFKVDSLWTDTSVVHKLDGTISYINFGFENANYEHHFFDHVDNIAHQKMHNHNYTYNTDLWVDSDSTYVIGYDNNFTAYFKKQYISAEEANPTWAYLISGTLVYDSNPDSSDSIFVGIENYRIAKKIVATEGNPNPGHYCKGTLKVFRPYYDTIVPYCNWDTLTDRHSSTHRF